MKMTYTRAFSLATALCLLLGLALGCSSASTEQAASQTAQAAAGTSQTEQATEQAVEQPTANDGTFTPPEGFTGGTPPQGFPGNFDGSNMPGGTPPDGFNGNFSGGTPPQGFPGNFDGSNMPNGTSPDGFNGNFNGGTPPQGFNGNFDGNMPNGTPPSGGMGEPPSGGMPGGGPGGSSADVTYSGAVEITSADSRSNETYESTTADESALLIATDQAVTIADATVNKTGNSDGGDSCNFYGLNAAVLVKDGAQVTITGGTITSDASGANGVFSYGGNGGQNGAAGDGTTVTIRDTTITTTGSGSGGIMTTGGGVTYAYDLTVTTSGQSSAAIRTDRGGGTVYVDGGTYTSNGLGSPAIYSTAEIHVANASLVSNLSEGVCIEGKNSIELVDCDLTANNTGMNGNATFLDSIMIYQSMSGDADSGTSSFTMTGGTLTSLSGHVFHVTNTNAIITLSGVTVVNEDSEGVLLSVSDDGWSGAGNVATLNADHETLEGLLLVGSDATLTLNLTGGSAFTGAVSGAISNAKGDVVSTEVGTVNVTLDESSTWTLTGDTYISSFIGDASGVISNGYTLYVNGVALTGTK